MASPKQIGKRPVAIGSKVPVCPALLALNTRFRAVTAPCELIPAGLSSNTTPSIRWDMALLNLSFSIAINSLINQSRHFDSMLNGSVVYKMQCWYGMNMQALE